MNFQLTKEFIELIELLITQKKNSELIKLFDRLLAADIAEVLEVLDFEKSKYLFDLFNQELSADILIELEDYLRERFLDDLSSKEIVEEFIENLDSVMSSIKFYKSSIEEFNFELIPDVDLVIHLAAQTSVPLSVENFFKDFIPTCY